MITPQRKLDEVRREIGMRASVYPRRVAAGKMSQFEADARIAVMRAIEADYQAAVTREKNQIALDL